MSKTKTETEAFETETKTWSLRLFKDETQTFRGRAQDLDQDFQDRDHIKSTELNTRVNGDKQQYDNGNKDMN